MMKILMMKKFKMWKKNPTVEENPLGSETESEGVDVDTFVAEILAKAKAESSASSSKRQKMMAKKMYHHGIPQDHLSKWFHLLSSGDHQESEVKSLLIQIMNLKRSIFLMMMKGMQIQLFHLSQRKKKMVFLKLLKSQLLKYK